MCRSNRRAQLPFGCTRGYAAHYNNIVSHSCVFDWPFFFPYRQVYMHIITKSESVSVFYSGFIISSRVCILHTQYTHIIILLLCEVYISRVDKLVWCNHLTPPFGILPSRSDEQITLQLHFLGPRDVHVAQLSRSLRDNRLPAEGSIARGLPAHLSIKQQT